MDTDWQIIYTCMDAQQRLKFLLILLDKLEKASFPRRSLRPVYLTLPAAFAQAVVLLYASHYPANQAILCAILGSFIVVSLVMLSVFWSHPRVAHCV